MWVKDDEIWQLSSGGKTLLHLAEAQAAFAAQLRRGYLIFGPVLLLGVMFLIWDHRARSQMRSTMTSGSSDVP
jgi:hypothetical protein